MTAARSRCRDEATTARRVDVRPVAAAAVLLLLAAAWSVLWTADLSAPLVLGFACGPVALVFATLAVHRVAVDPTQPEPARRFWRSVRLAGALALAGGVIDTVGVALDAPPPRELPGLSPLAASPMLVALVVLLAAVLRLPPRPRSRGHWAQLLLDGVTILLGAALIFWHFALAPAIDAGSAPTAVATALVGLAGLLALTALSKVLLAAAAPVGAGALRLLAASLVIAGTAPAAMLMLGVPGQLLGGVSALPAVALCGAAAAVCGQRAARRPSAGTTTVVTRRTYSLLPYGALAAAGALLVAVTAGELSRSGQVVVAGAVAVTAAVVARQVVGLRDNARLLRSVRRHQARLEYQAHHDALTQLANRTMLTARLAQALAERGGVAVLLIDLDDFKTVNDTLGHAVGDEMLVAVADRLRLAIDPGDLAARLGGDEFAVLVRDADPARADEVATRILAGLAAPVTASGHQLLVQASIGVAPAGPGDGPDEVLRNADIAMYAAKENGKASWSRFAPEMRQEIVEHVRLGGELHEALERDQLYLEYQPIVDLDTRRLVGAEALVRWRHPEQGLIPPGQFIPVAERTGLIVPLGRWVLRQACRQLAAWRDEYGTSALYTVGVNVAARQLGEPGFTGDVAAALRDAGLAPHRLVIEVTESSVLNARQVLKTLHELHRLGVKLALDDFGTRQSSLGLLRAFPVDILKLDKSFVDGIEDGQDDERLAVAAAVAQMAAALRLDAVAEGIESAAQVERLRPLGYRLGQGFHLARPLAAERVAELLVESDFSLAGPETTP
ncbi:diguanylate cyclase (GGDEF) domain-containing protein [Micromonospora pattaloongensis]|uniref:Diguanylate cyclase (GGDEF) domain-containing protein n=1 Tax=Micromonospora pattaloongensis TaxID=405436 RepID=A0A1H3NQ24_9ACTN|nr:EAL domain-containing protein [Micromonospora pattaloongensis]SDY91002.1 diguanylate cyclase (GGDEF) domain-containing protein [Micromonospora pattaloongensis]